MTAQIYTGMVPSVYNLGATSGWEVDATPLPLYSRKFTKWVNLGAEMDGSVKRHPHGGSNPKPSIPTTLSRPPTEM